jgi:Zinc knuckle
LENVSYKYLTANPRQIYADARVYYSSHFVRKRLEQATAAAIAAATASIKPIAVGLDEDSPQVLAIDNRDNRDSRDNRDNRDNRTMHGRRGMQRKEYPTDPDGYCTLHRRTGHPTEQCRARLQPPTTDIQCYNCNKFGHKSPDCPERNCYAPSPMLTPACGEPPIQLQVPLRIRTIQTPTSGIPAHPSEQPRILMIRAAASWIAAHLSKEQSRIRMIQAPTLGIPAHLFNASDSANTHLMHGSSTQPAHIT